MAAAHPETLNVVQLSDLHFSVAPGGYMLRDTAETFAAVAAQVAEDRPDLVVVTGDIANEGHPDEYAMAGAALEALDWMQPVVAVAGEGATEPNLAAAFSSFGFKPIEGQPD